jgi:hypothetical protein
MDQFSFHGPFAYRWIDDVPVERIDLRSGERRSIEVGGCGIPPVSLPERSVDTQASPGEEARDGEASETVVRAAMAAWN